LFSTGQPFLATFKLNRSITRRFTAYAAIFLPNGGMIDAITFSSKLKPVATLPGLDAPFSYVLIARPVPAAPTGIYEVVAAFFDPSKPITSREDAFLEASGKFEIR
jgi:hypothetical protein